MGSKRSMLRNGLGEVLRDELSEARRFFDLFAGTGAVSIFVAERFEVPVFAFDLQRYAAVLTGSVVSRDKKFPWQDAWQDWHASASLVARGVPVPTVKKISKSAVDAARQWCARQTDLQLTAGYGGHYFSPAQAVWIDSLLLTLPRRNPARTVALASLIRSASECAASPGHTAQPFQPTLGASKFLMEAWERDVVDRTQRAFEAVSDQCAVVAGNAEVGDANDAAHSLRKGDVVFIDPPYSAVHYSRFYHVLESIARGRLGEVSGSGRYPVQSERPRSRYSVPSEARGAFVDLLETIAMRGARAIVTFPNHECSNWLSGDDVKEIARQYFKIRSLSVSSTFSTLGGPKGVQQNPGRFARRQTSEMVLVLHPK